jgi:two-component system sensor histidine kinase YesM
MKSGMKKQMKIKLKRKDKPSRRKRSMFLHLTIIFMLVGLLPLVAIGSLFVERYSGNMREIVIDNAFSKANFMSRSIEEIISRLDEKLKYLYDYNAEDYTSFYKILEDKSLNSGQLAVKIESILIIILYMDNDIEGVRFIDGNNKLYSVYRDPTKNIYGKIMLSDRLTGTNTADYKKQYLLPTIKENRYYYPSEQYIFTSARYYMDTATVASANNKPMGTLYLDVNINKLKKVVDDIQLYEKSNVYIVDKNTGRYIYSPDENDYSKAFGDKKVLMQLAANRYKQEKDYILTGQEIDGSSWLIVTRIYNQDILRLYKENVTYFSVILIGACVLLIIINLLSSRKISLPARELKSAMVEIERGNLDTRVNLSSQDEMGYLAEGLNHMVENLQKYISKVYVAELRQREAQLNALRTQISPHYLYNTLDVIRMTAISNNDGKTASMLDSLSGQLRYVIGQSSDRVALRRELENIREYFVIVKIRYEDKLELDIDVNKEELDLYVMKLLLQPVVENAVKHGFKNKREKGRISIRINRREDCLEITVMDDGVGMSADKLRQLNDLLGREEIGLKTEDGWLSVGVKNVYDRIKKYYGEEYGFEITSCESLGTIVKFRLPVLEQAEESEAEKNV